MKNEYFGDVRDLFKYDLAFQLLRHIRSLQRLTFVPMLTPDWGNGHGRRTNYENALAGRGSERLVKFLKYCVKHGRRHIRQLERFFQADDLRRTTKLVIYSAGNYFRHRDRDAYFNSLPRRLLLNALVLVDPDNGLEVKSAGSKGEKYLKYQEAESLWTKMGTGSLLVLFQYIPRVQRRPYFRRIARRLCLFASSVYYVSDNQVVFFLLPKGKRVQYVLNRVLSDYAAQNGLFFMCTNDRSCVPSRATATGTGQPNLKNSLYTRRRNSAIISGRISRPDVQGGRDHVEGRILD